VFDFLHACIHHDGCYQGLNRAGDPARISRFSCDNTFLADMRASCEVPRTTFPANLKRCRDTAVLYYAAVRIFGGKSYQGSGSRL
jgi:Prokaryotic phospholipase A2.